MILKKLTMEDICLRVPAAVSGAAVYAYLHELSPDIGVCEKQTYPAVVLCPGGGYTFTSDREADPIAFKFMAAGYDVFTLRYAVAPDRYPTALMELLATVAHIRQNAAEYHVDPAKVAVCGFSAGGHLAASGALLWGEPPFADALGFSPAEMRPDAAVLCYPVITSGEFAHRGSFENLLGADADETAVAAQSLENRVTSDVPPVFLWHTWSDEVVPVENTLLFAAALRKNGVPFELHIYPEGRHGLSLADKLTWNCNDFNVTEPHLTSWIGLATDWLDMILDNNR